MFSLEFIAGLVLFVLVIIASAMIWEWKTNWSEEFPENLTETVADIEKRLSWLEENVMTSNPKTEQDGKDKRA